MNRSKCEKNPILLSLLLITLIFPRHSINNKPSNWMQGIHLLKRSFKPQVIWTHIFQYYWVITKSTYTVPSMSSMDKEENSFSQSPSKDSTK
jgi:hypothetical protein